MVQVQYFGIDTRYDLKILHQCDKRIKTKIQKVCGLSTLFVEVTEGKLVGGLFALQPPPPNPNRVKAYIPTANEIKTYFLFPVFFSATTRVIHRH